MKYPFAAFDLDGTLLNDKKIISEKNLYALEALHTQGTELVIATGRGKTKASFLTADIRSEKTLICNNGAEIFRNGKRWKTNFLSEELFREVYEIGKTLAMKPYVFVQDEKFSILIPKTQRKEAHLGSVCSISEIGYFDEIKEKKVLSCVYIDISEKIHTLVTRLNHLKSIVAMHQLSSFETSKTSIRMLEVLHPDANKLTAIREITQNGDYMAFGDENNDIAMIESATYGVAMKNATSGLKEVADKISDFDNNHDGVYYEIMKVLGVL